MSIKNATHLEIYDPRTDTWSTGKMDITSKGAGVIAGNSEIYVAGGFVNGVGSDRYGSWSFDHLKSQTIKTGIDR